MLRAVAFVVLAIACLTTLAVHSGRMTSPTEVVERLASRPEVSSRFQDSSENGLVIRGCSAIRVTFMSKAKSVRTGPTAEKAPEIGAALR